MALIIAAGWLGSQRHSISTLEKESELLQEHIEMARSSLAVTEHSPAGPAAASKTPKGKEPLDWKKIAAQMREMQQGGGMGDMRTMIRMQQRLQTMTKEELIAALDNIATLDLTGEERLMLEQMLLGPLAQKDPEVALTKFIDRMNEGHGTMGWVLGNAMSEWAKKDPVAAAAWFDQQIAAGKFDSKTLDGKSAARTQFESALIRVLLDSDPEAAGRRLATLPTGERGDVLKNYTATPLKEESQMAFAKLVRSQLPEKEQGQVLAQQAAHLVGEDYSKATAFLERIEATPAERSACVEQAAESRIQSISFNQKITAKDLDTMREWTTSQAPDTTDRVTGEALSRTLQGQNKMDFAEAATLAARYQEASGGDDVLYAFLDGYIPEEDREQARVLAEKITDETRRNRILPRFKPR